MRKIDVGIVFKDNGFVFKIDNLTDQFDNEMEREIADKVQSAVLDALDSCCRKPDMDYSAEFIYYDGDEGEEDL